MSNIDVTKLPVVDIEDGSVLGVRGGGITRLNKSSLIQGLTKASDLSASDGASNIGFKQAPASAGIRTGLSKLRETISVLDFFANGVSGELVDPTGGIESTLGIQAALNYCVDNTVNHSKNLLIPPGVYKTGSLTIPASGAGNFSINAHGARFIAISGLTDYLLKITTTSYNGNNLKIHGLYVDGNFTAKGIYLNAAQEWIFSGVKIWNCVEGINLQNTFYGEISNESIIRNCLVGITLGDGISGEVNTVKFDNIKINFSVAKTLFVPKNAGESDADYNIRVVSIGLDLRCILLQPKFDGITFEGMDYGVFGMRHAAGAAGVNNMIFDFSKCYFEAIKVCPINLTQQTGFANSSGIVVSITNSHFANSTPEIRLGHGKYKIIQNGTTPNVRLYNDSIFRTVLETDVDPSKVILESSLSTTTTVRQRGFVTSANPYKYNAYGNDNPFPAYANMLPTIEDANYVTVPPVIRKTGLLSAYRPVMNITAKPLTFIPTVGRPAGPVLVDEINNNYYMVSCASGVLKLTQVVNLFRIDSPVGGLLAMEMYRNTSIPNGTVAFCIDLQINLTKNSSGKWVNTNGNICIGTTAEIIAQNSYGSTFDVERRWNVQTDLGWVWWGSYWSSGPDWYGVVGNNRAVGTAAQRPVAPTVPRMIYYATDTDTYSEWKNAVWASFTKLF